MDSLTRLHNLEEAVAKLQYKNQELESRITELEMQLDFDQLDEIELTAAERDQMEFDEFFDEESERFGEEM